MEGEEIGMVLARASELRSKISVFIEGGGGDPGDQAGDACGGSLTEGCADEDGEEGEAESLVGIHDALHSLERQLAALQALQHQQRYERESTLAQIDRSRMILLSKLKEYTGEELEVIQEVGAFAAEAIEHDDGLVLPPYPNHLPDLFVLDGIGAGSCSVKDEPACDVPIASNKNEFNGTACQTDKNEGSKTSTGIKHVIGMVIKSALTFAGVISILSFAGYQPAVRRKPPPTERRSSIRRPPGKSLVIEDSKAQCIVKERIEVPFESDVTSPSIRYGFG